MQLISNRFIPTEEVRRLTVGSFEHVIARIEEALRANAVRIFGKKIESQVVGTFPGYAIVLSEEGNFARVKYQDADGIISLLQHESIEIGSFSADNLDSYLKTEATKASQALTQGNVKEAVTRLLAISRLVETNDAPDQLRTVEAIASFHHASRPWKDLFEGKGDTIRRMVLDEVPAIHEDRLQVKFRSLYDRSSSRADHEKYRALVIESVSKIGDRAGGLSSQVATALSSIKTDRDLDEPVRSLIAFGADLVEDLNSIRKTFAEAPHRFSNVAALGKLHDVFAEDFRSRELAGRFVIKMSSRLGAHS